MRRIDCVFETVDTLHIGSGKKGASEKSRIGVQKLHGQPVIPGSTIRGALRANLLSLIPSINKLASSPLKEFLDGMSGEDVVTHLFGAPNVRGRIIVSDATIVSSVKTGAIPGIRIESSSRTVAKHALFFYEAVPSGVTFSTSVYIQTPGKENEDQKRIDLFLFLLALKRIEKSGLGRHRSTIIVDIGEHAEVLDSLKEDMLNHE